MLCPLCHQRKAKRGCPALGGLICAVCCGTKRLVEIRCPADCVYLATAQSHPPAVVQRQQEHDRAFLLPLLGGLSDRQARVFLMVAALIARHQGDPLQTLVDGDIGLATEALAATLETSARGIVYDHRAATVPADRLLTELRTLVAEIAKEGGSALERDAAAALRRIEHAARQSAKLDTRSTAFHQLLGRVLLPPAGSAQAEGSPNPAASPLVII
jgi:hypothetical protein